ncbi:MAG: murein biosynthesis integral membrane protein MurJ [Cyanobacteria bacterium NC_groundwater_1444_Ag_S-0.65um_54_12]|nr:murein biosynthesis integral membrane protein MurJ [Cyanobacteria bacterium NC_groundwater_1444_Ag_S-0.65um_54_12]
MGKFRSILGIVSLIAGLVIIAKLFGFLRQVVVANAFGKGSELDAYNLAYQLPAYAIVLLGGLNGPFHTATIATLTRMREAGRNDHASIIFTLLLLAGGLTGLIALLIFFLADQIIALQGPWVNRATHDLAVAELRIMVPVILLGSWLGILCGIAHAKEKYALASLSPLLSSVAIIGCVLWQPGNPLMLAIGTLGGALAQLLFQGLPLLFTANHRSLQVRPARLQDKAIRDTAHLLGPAILASTIGQINVFIGTFFLSRAGVGAISSWGYANVIYQMPLGILLASLLVPIFPRLTAAAARGEHADLAAWLDRGVSLVGLICLPLTAGLFLLAMPVVRIAFERGQFAVTHATESTALVLTILSLGFLAYAWRDLLVRVFYALNDSRTPLRISLLSVGLNFGLNAFFMFGPHELLGLDRYFGENHQLAGIALATAMVTWINLAQVAWALRCKLGKALALQHSTGLLLRATAAVLVAIMSGLVLLRLAWPAGLGGAVLQVMVIASLAGSSYAGVLFLLGKKSLIALRRQDAGN